VTATYRRRWSTIQMKAARSLSTTVTVCKSTGRHIPEGFGLQHQRRRNQWRMQNFRESVRKLLSVLSVVCGQKLGNPHEEARRNEPHASWSRQRLERQFRILRLSQRYSATESVKEIPTSFKIHRQISDHYKELSRTWEADSRSASKAFQRFNTSTARGPCWTLS